MLIFVGKDGAPLDIKVSRSSGSRELDRSAIDAAIRWRFLPKIKNGVAVEGYVRVPVTFSDQGIKSDPVWTPAYRRAPIRLDDDPIPYATVEQAIVGVAARARAGVYDSAHQKIHVYAIRDDRKVVRELWYFMDAMTDQAMAVRYIFTGKPDEPVTLVATLCNNVAVCKRREPWVKAGPYTKRLFTE